MEALKHSAMDFSISPSFAEAATNEEPQKHL